MPIQLDQLPMLSPSQINPWVGVLPAMQQGLQTGMAMRQFPLELQKQQIANQLEQAKVPYAAKQAMADAAYKQAMAEYLTSPNQMLRNLTPTGKTYVEPSVVQAVLGKYGVKPKEPIEGFEYDTEQNNSPPSITPSPPEMDKAYKTYRQKITQDPVLARQANAAQNIYNEVNDIDTGPLEKFSGLGGKLNLMKEQGKGVLSSLGVDIEPSKDWREYNAYMSINKNAIMDAIRKALSTSVVPGYVGSTLAPMVDPASPIWNDPRQVKQNIDTLKDWLKSYASEQTSAMAEGVPQTLEESEERFKSAKNSGTKKSKYSLEDLQYTAKQYNMTVPEVLKYLGG